MNNCFIVNHCRGDLKACFLLQLSCLWVIMAQHSLTFLCIILCAAQVAPLPISCRIHGGLIQNIQSLLEKMVKLSSDLKRSLYFQGLKIYCTDIDGICFWIDLGPMCVLICFREVYSHWSALITMLVLHSLSLRLSQTPLHRWAFSFLSLFRHIR